MLYFQSPNLGLGFITHADNEYSQIYGYPGNIWVTELNQTWADRVGATSLTYQQAQNIVDAIITEEQANWTSDLQIPYPEPIILPQ